MSRMISYLCGPCQQQRHIASCCVDLTPEPSLVIHCAHCGSTHCFPVTLGQALNVKAQRIADVMEIQAFADWLDVVETPADMGVTSG